MRVLGIETSCDDTGIAIYDQKYGLLANQLYSQANLHTKYGGVVPELAARNHAHNIVPLILSALTQANSEISDIHGIAYTAGPGLTGSLMVGAVIGRSLSYAWKIPAIAINHMEGHLLSPMLTNNVSIFPCVALLVSGGHTQLILATKMGVYKLLGRSIDDAIGEVFDKIAMLLGLNYPGGPMLEKLAKIGVPGRYVFPRPMIDRPGLNFSFSGLKTYVSNLIRTHNNNNQIRADIARAFEDSVVETLMIKCQRALNLTKLNHLIVAGGVSSNNSLRTCLSTMMKQRKGKIFYAHPKFCTDNGAMIAYSGILHLLLGEKYNHLEISVLPRWSLEELSKINKVDTE